MSTPRSASQWLFYLLGVAFMAAMAGLLTSATPPAHPLTNGDEDQHHHHTPKASTRPAWTANRYVLVSLAVAWAAYGAVFWLQDPALRDLMYSVLDIVTKGLLAAYIAFKCTART